MALKKIYRGMQNAAETIWENFEDLSNLFVKTTDNQTIQGVKNFQNGIQVAGKNPVLTKTTLDYAMVDKNNNASVMADGSLKLYRRGDLVYLTGSFKLSAAKHNQGVWFSPPTWARPAEPPRMYFRATSGSMALLFYNVSEYDAIVCIDNIAKDQWLTGSATWLAKDPY